MNKKNVLNVMTKIEDYPRIPHSFTVAEALEELVKYSNKGYRHILVFDERFKLVGVLSLRDLLRDLEPGLFKTKWASKFQGLMTEDDSLLAVMWEDAFFSNCRKQMKRKISEILEPVKIITVEPNIPLISALFLMLKENVNALPVLEKGVVIGVIRLGDIVKEILKTCENSEEVSN
jgi:CBS domain-containing protein